MDEGYKKNLHTLEAILKSLKIEKTALKGIGLNHETHSSMIPLFSIDSTFVSNYYTDVHCQIRNNGREEQKLQYIAVIKIYRNFYIHILSILVPSQLLPDAY